MSYDGTSGYEVSRCPECENLMWNGRCENPDCKFHWQPLEEQAE